MRVRIESIPPQNSGLIMKYDKQICADIILINTPHKDLFMKTRDEIYGRRRASGGEKGAIFETKSGLKGQEKELLTGFAKEYINGEILGVDNVLDDGINVSAKVSFDELHRIRMSLMRFRVLTEVNL